MAFLVQKFCEEFFCQNSFQAILRKKRKKNQGVVRTYGWATKKKTNFHLSKVRSLSIEIHKTSYYFL